MASTYTDGLAVEIIGSGDKAGSWGDVTNNNLKALEEGISRYAEIGAAGSNTSTLNVPDGQTAYTDDSKGRSAVIKWTGAIASGSHHTVTLQVGAATATQARFTAINGLDSTHTLRITTATMAAGGAPTYLEIPNGYSAEIHIDGAVKVINSLVNLSIDKLALGNQEVISNTVDDRVDIVSSTLQVGDGSGVAVIQSDGTGGADRDLLLRTSSAAASGQIRFNDATNGPIEITPGGEGSVVMGKVDIGGGEIDGTPIGANAASTGVFTSVGTTSDGAITANGSGNISTTSGDILTASGSMGVGVSSPGGSGNISADGLITTSGNITTTSTGTITAANGLTVTTGGIDLNGGNLDLASGGIANTGAIAGATTINASGNITGNLVGDISGNAATVTTNANLTGPVTSSGNATTIAPGVVTGSNFNITSGSVSGDYLLAADGTGGGLKWIDQPAGDITGVTAGTNLNGGGSEGAVTVNLDSAISLANVTTSSKIIVGADSDFITGTPYIASQGGVRSSTYTSRTVDQAIDISPNGTGKLSLTSANTGIDGIDITSTAGGVHVDIGEYDDAVYFKVPNNIGESSALQFIVTRTGPYLHENGGRYLNFSSGTGSGGFGLRGTNSYLEASNRPSDGWGQVYHSGMTSGQGAYIEIVSSSILANTDGGTTAHLMGQTPRIVTVEARCKVAEYGYSADDIVYVGYGSMSDNRGVTVSANATTIQFSIGNGGIEIIERDPSGTNGQQGLDNDTNWELKIRAWK